VKSIYFFLLSLRMLSIYIASQSPTAMGSIHDALSTGINALQIDPIHPLRYSTDETYAFVVYYDFLRYLGDEDCLTLQVFVKSIETISLN